MTVAFTNGLWHSTTTGLSVLGVCTVSIIDSKGGHKFPSVQRALDTTLANIECLLSFAFEQREDFSQHIVLEKEFPI